MYVQRNTAARSRNHFCNENATMRYVCIIEVIMVNNITILCCTKMFYGKFMLPATSKRTSVFMLSARQSNLQLLDTFGISR